jgi:hypothetical protein
MDDRKRALIGSAAVELVGVLEHLGSGFSVHSRELDFVTALVATTRDASEEPTFFADELVAHVGCAAVVTADTVGALRPVLADLVGDGLRHSLMPSLMSSKRSKVPKLMRRFM